VRLNLGAVLLEAGRPDEAEAVFWEDLRKNPGTGWALAGLAQALKAQGRNEEAARVDERFRKAWQHADFELNTSRIGT
jgi:predicted Zn-dependent protease